MNRRDFLKLMSAATTVVASGACDVKEKAPKIIPYVLPPVEEIIPGFPLYYRTSLAELPDGSGVTVTAYDKVIGKRHEMCPTKLEGTEGHPINDGGLSVQGQAELYRLYCPERYTNPCAPQPNGNLKKMTWQDASNQIAKELKKSAESGKKNYYLSGKTTGSLSELIDSFCVNSKVFRSKEYEPFSQAAIRKANGLLFGDAVVPRYNIVNADFLLTVGADIMETFVSPVFYSKQFAKARKGGHFNWHHVEPGITQTGMTADERFVIAPESEPWLLAYLLKQIAKSNHVPNKISDKIIDALPDVSAKSISEKTGLPVDSLNRIAGAFKEAKHPLLIAGGSATAHECALESAFLAGLIQWTTGQMGATVDFTHAENPGNLGDLNDMKALSDELSEGNVGVLFISRADPIANLPSSFDFEKNIKKAKLTVGIGMLPTETLQLCDIVLPLSHSLESWGDIEPRRGIISPIQPATKPIFNNRSEGDILIGILNAAGQEAPAATNQEYVFSRWANNYGEDFADEFLKTGWHEEKVKDVKVKLDSGEARNAIEAAQWPKTDVAGLTLALFPSPRFYDGRYTDLDTGGEADPRTDVHRNLLREIPDTLTSISWGDWISVSPVTAKALGIADRSMVQIPAIGSENSGIKLGAKVQPRLQGRLATIQRGMQKQKAFQKSFGYDKRSGEHIWFAKGVNLASANAIDNELCIMSGSQSQEGRGYIPYPIDDEKQQEHDRQIGLHTTGEDKRGKRITAMALAAASGKGGGASEPHEGESESAAQTEHLEHKAGHHHGKAGGLYRGHTYPDYRWAMAVDLDLCTGCSACVAACHIENNIPAVGSQAHLNGREMSWIRLEAYYEKEGETFLPMMCQQCDYAPCEPVCPVYATYHNPEGLNAMVYSRCVGTRYCFNNCPYKVRRFNWFDHKWNGPLERMLNPNVWPRDKGVMEKCTFCVQRIRMAKDGAKDEGRKVGDGEVRTACQQTCPTNAITFGNLLDEKATVTKKATSGREYRVLEQLGIEPAIFYLKGAPHKEYGLLAEEKRLPIGQAGKMPSASNVKPGEEFQAPQLDKVNTLPTDKVTTGGETKK